MKTVFIGAVEGSARALQALCTAGVAPDLVVTLPLSRAQAHSDFADLGPIAQAHGIALHRTPRSAAPETLAAIAACAPDLVVIIGWSQLVGAELRAVPRIGVLGFHPSALPRMRGRAVIPWHILTGQRQGGATLFWIGAGLDDGPIAAQTVFDIDPDRITARALYDRAVTEMVTLLPPLLDDIAHGARPVRPQVEAQATICARRRPEDGLIDWTAPAAQIDRLIRAVGPPYPGARSHTSAGMPLTLLRARPCPEPGRFIGLPGQVQQVGPAGDLAPPCLTVMCGDGHCVDILDWVCSDPPRRHEMLGAPPPDLLERRTAWTGLPTTAQS
ncbi:MAG: formyltransferase family protein [Celeribacter sp.]|jgi:methionyl-tRNA formyltransferase